ncbi:hypothetical protein [Bacillus sp. FJAT-47783]|uniref:hypothetical protein n=1 Tax=Bacillus sp. FJAT-47783 TaxID=2922712 RepID=UPI001FADC888|nr:hypothetical protein [Bacillus sp. FJAT-47783]
MIPLLGAKPLILIPLSVSILKRHHLIQEWCPQSLQAGPSLLKNGANTFSHW